MLELKESKMPELWISSFHFNSRREVIGGTADFTRRFRETEQLQNDAQRDGEIYQVVIDGKVTYDEQVNDQLDSQSRINAGRRIATNLCHGRKGHVDYEVVNGRHMNGGRIYHADRAPNAHVDALVESIDRTLQEFYNRAVESRGNVQGTD